MKKRKSEVKHKFKEKKKPKKAPAKNKAKHESKTRRKRKAKNLKIKEVPKRNKKIREENKKLEIKKKDIKKEEERRRGGEKRKKSNAKHIKREYKNLQRLYKKVYKEEKKKNNKENLSRLHSYEKNFAKKFEKLRKDPSKIEQLAVEIEQGTKILISIKSSKQKIISHGQKTASTHHAKKEKKHGTVLEKYEIEVDGAVVSVEIIKEEMGVVYQLSIPKIDLPTATLLNDIRNELITITTISMKELIDPKAFFVIKERFMKDAAKLIYKKLPNISKETEKFLIGKLIQDMLGLGKIEFLIDDPSLEEIVITSSKEPIRVYSKKYGWLKTNLKIEKEEDIINYSNIIARRVGRQITVLSPLLDAHLVTGDRINAVLYPINTKGNTITIRKFARDPYTIIDLINNKTCDLDIAALLWLAIEYEMNVIISGGTASGKTVFLNACMPFIPPNHRIISIEDTRELMLPEFLYWTPLVTRTPNPEGKGEVSMLDLLVNSLRMRPDRIVLGEMRRHEEAMVLFEAMHTGHSVYATVHADSSAETISRLINPPINVPPNLLKSVNLNVVMFRDRKKGIRRIFQISEFEAEADSAKANVLYRWVPEKDKIVQHSESSRFFEDISRHTGMPQTEIKKDLQEKVKILSWLIKNKIRSLKDFGKVMNFYYKNKEMLLKEINKNNVKAIFDS